MGSYRKNSNFSKSATLDDGSTLLLNYRIIWMWVQMMSKADDAFLHVHLDHVQPESQSQDHTITSRSAFGCKIQSVQEPDLALTAKMLRKCSCQDHWPKDTAYQEWVLKDKLAWHAKFSSFCVCVLYCCSSPYKI